MVIAYDIDNIMVDDNNIKIFNYDRLRISFIDYELNVFNIISKIPELVTNHELKVRTGIERENLL